MDISVPPTLISFAVGVTDANQVLSPEFKKAGSKLVLAETKKDERGVIDFAEYKKNMDKVHELAKAGQILSANVIGKGGLFMAAVKMAVGNMIGAKLEGFTKEDSAAVIDQVDRFAKAFEEKNGSRMFFCSDEFYLKAELPLPDESYYEGYPQIENGVGMITSLVTEFKEELNYLDEYLEHYQFPRHVSIATGVAAYDTIKAMAVELEARVEGLQVDVYKIINRFFGETITVSGLLTGKDISEQLSGKDLGDLLLFPGNALRADGDLFLDDMSPESLSQKLGVAVSPSRDSGEGFLCDVLGVEHHI
jgi:NifB/MoaA-like Fe-S oxidoreductase